MRTLDASRSNAAAPKPTIGESSRDMPTSEALAQLTPSPQLCPPLRAELARPTPRIEPMRVCELEAGSPRYHVPRFQMIAEIRSENTMANPAADPALTTSSTGRSDRIPNATAPEDRSTPSRFQKPDQTTAGVGFSVC